MGSKLSFFVESMKLREDKEILSAALARQYTIIELNDHEMPIISQTVSIRGG